MGFTDEHTDETTLRTAIFIHYKPIFTELCTASRKRRRPERRIEKDLSDLHEQGLVGEKGHDEKRVRCYLSLVDFGANYSVGPTGCDLRSAHAIYAVVTNRAEELQCLKHERDAIEDFA